MKSKVVFSFVLIICLLAASSQAIAQYPGPGNLTPDGLPTAASWSVTDSNPDETDFGYAMAIGDLNGDHYDDLVVGAGYYPNSGGGYGRVFVYFGSASGLPSSPSWYAESPTTDIGFGYAVAVANVNGDAYDDLVASGWYYTNGQTEEGVIAVWFGKAIWTGVGNLGNASQLIESNVANLHLGVHLASAGYVNGTSGADAYEDIISSTYFYNTGQNKFYGGVKVFAGSGSGLNPAAIFTNQSATHSDGYGYAIAGIGDVDKNGYGDIAVGAPSVGHFTGQAYVYLSTSAGPSTSGAWTINGSGQNDAAFGLGLSPAGDINNDGYADFAIGEGGYNGYPLSEVDGRAYVFFGKATQPTGPDLTLTGPSTAEDFGWSVTSAGDVNHDTYPDLLVGAATSSNAGSAFVFYGTGATLNPAPKWEVYGAVESGRLGYALAAGDVNHDGYSDVFITQPDYDYVHEAAFGYYGNPDSDVVGLTAANNSPISAGSGVTLTASVTGGTGISYTWDFGDGTTGKGREVSHQYIHAGVFNAAVTAISTNSQIAYTKVTVYEPLSVSPGTGVTTSDSILDIQAPADLPVGLIVNYTPETTYFNPIGSLFQFGGISFILGATDVNYNPVTIPSRPLTLTLHYIPAALPPGVVENSLEIVRYQTSVWIPLTILGRDLVAHTITVRLDHFSEFALAQFIGQNYYVPMVKKN